MKPNVLELYILREFTENIKNSFKKIHQNGFCFLKDKSMKKSILLLAILPFLIFGNCKDKSISEAECTPVVNTMFENIKAAVPSGDEIERNKVMLIATLQKECQSGKFNLDCLKNAKSITEIPLCQNK